ncbi:retrovirus-related Pol polyprotein from transposon 412 [Trichonephila clavipes]|nr:retrovirus-related Pol polyprotein from transposon 412 [Trichonephila clavipes]
MTSHEFSPLEVTTQANRRVHQSNQGARVTLDAPCESPWKSDIEKLRDEFKALMAQRQKQEKRNYKCWKNNIWRSRGVEVATDNEKPYHKILQFTAVNGGDKGLYVIGQINNISCRTVLDTGANVSISRKDLTKNSKLSIIWMPPCVSLQTVMGDKIQVHGKANVTLRFGIDYHHTVYIADITDTCILGLDF